jgi:hypothetical protein
MIVEMPDGTKVSFPDDMPKEQIKSLIASKFPEVAQPQEKPHDVSSILNRMYELGPAESAMRIGGGLAEGAKNLATGVVQSAKDAFTAPGRALTGELRMTDESGRTSPEAIAESFNMATWVNPASVAMGTGKQIARNAAMDMAKRPPSEGAMVAQAARDIGVSLPRAVTSDSASVQNVGKRLSQIPVVGTPLRNASKTSIQQLDDAAKGVQDKLGAGSKEFAGERIGAGISDFAKIAEPANVKALYDKVDDLVDPKVRVPLSDTARAASEITKTRKYQGPSNAVEQVRLALDDPTGLSYKEIKELRTSIGELKNKKGLLDQYKISQQEIDDIYAGLSTDLRNAAIKAGGPDGLKAFEQANTRARIFARDKEALKKVLGEGSDEKIVANLIAKASNSSRADLKGLMLAKSKVSKETWDEFASAALADMGRDASGNFTPDRFVTEWGKKSESGKKLLFGGNPEHLKSLESIATVSKRFKQLNEFANPSGTGGQVIAGSGLVSIGAGFFEPTILASTLISAATGRTVASLMARPTSAKALADYAKAYEVAARMPGRASQNALANKAKALALVAANGNEVGASNLAAKLATVQQTAADQENSEQVGRPEGDPEAAQSSQQFNDAYLQGRAF